MEYKRNEIGAGIFLLVSFVILAVMIFAVSDIKSLFIKKKVIKVLFRYSDGIEKNAQVRLSGIRIGDVADVRVAPEQGDKIELALRIYSDTVIREDTKAAIKTLGLVGGKYVELTGGSPSARVLKPGDMLIGEESFKLEDLTKAGLEVVGKLTNIANNLDRMLGDPALSKSIHAAIRNVADATENVKVMTSGKEEVAQGLKNLPEMLKKLDATAANLKSITDKADALMGKTDAIMSKTDAIVGKTDALLDENRKNIDAMLESVKDTAQNLKELTDDVKKHPWKLIRKP
jgi:phospholipid/cholesterol/gamma-HCH transport system substrate-binding protein